MTRIEFSGKQEHCGVKSFASNIFVTSSFNIDIFLFCVTITLIT